MVRRLLFPANTVLLVVSGIMIGSLALLADLVVGRGTGVDPGVRLRGHPGGSTRALRIAVVGPTHPIRGRGGCPRPNSPTICGPRVMTSPSSRGRRIYPTRLYPGETTVPTDQPEVTPFRRPPGRSTGPVRSAGGGLVGELAAYDLVLVVHVIPQVVPAHLTLIRAATARPTPPRIVALVHNVLPHEPKPGDESLMRAFLTRVDGVIVHTKQQAIVAISLGAEHVRTLVLPPHLPGGPRRRGRRTPTGPPRRARHRPALQGLDLLLAALAQVLISP